MCCWLIFTTVLARWYVSDPSWVTQKLWSMVKVCCCHFSQKRFIPSKACLWDGIRILCCESWDLGCHLLKQSLGLRPLASITAPCQTPALTAVNPSGGGLWISLILAHAFPIGRGWRSPFPLYQWALPNPPRPRENGLDKEIYPFFITSKKDSIELHQHILPCLLKTVRSWRKSCAFILATPAPIIPPSVPGAEYVFVERMHKWMSK